jgi:hypothetical protein
MLMILAICRNIPFADAQQSLTDFVLSGVLDSTVNYTAGAGDSPAHSWGIEEYANLRLRARTGERTVFYAAFNLIALSGNYLENAIKPGNPNLVNNIGTTPLYYGQNYAGAMELERLYFRINGDLFDAEAGLLRMNFGYGQVWGSSDFLNPRNPLSHNARPRGVLGTNFSFYPLDSLKILAFVAGPGEPLSSDGGGFISGLSLDQHWDRASLQFLYAYETPKSNETLQSFNTPPPPADTFTDSPWGLHRFGLSLKADLELGFTVDALYTLNPDKLDGIEGLSLGTGFDYNFIGGDLYILFEYLFNGLLSVTSPADGGIWMNHHYLSGSAAYRFNDHSSITLSTIFCFNDLSFTPFARLEYEVFQGFTLNLSAFVRLDQYTLRRGKKGELGPIPPGFDGQGNPVNEGSRVSINAGARLRF